MIQLMNANTLSAIVASVLTAMLLFPPASAHAQHERRRLHADPTHTYAPPTAARQRVSLAQAVETVQRSTGGRVLDAKDVGGQYRIKVLTGRGEVLVVYVDAETGSIRR